jgi:hypothetical protein
MSTLNCQHLNRDDRHFLAETFGSPRMRRAALEDEIRHHGVIANSIDMRPIAGDGDLPGDDGGLWAIDEARRDVRSRTRAIQRDANVRDYKFTQEAVAKGQAAEAKRRSA